MFRMYRLTVFLSVVSWYPLAKTFERGPVAYAEWAIWLYSAIILLAAFSFFWNILSAGVVKPGFIDAIRVPIAAIALGLNSAYYHANFAEVRLQDLVSKPSVQYLWIGIEILLTLSIMLGIQSLEGIATKEKKPATA